MENFGLEPDDLNSYFEPKVCSQCVHFYNPRSCGKKCDERGSTEMRLCHQQYWCDANTNRCDTDFEEISIENDPRVDDDDDKINELWQKHNELWQKITKTHIRDHAFGTIVPNKQKEIPYLYIGLLQNSEQGLQEFSSIETNYQRVEMLPLDWDFIYKSGGMRRYPLISDGSENTIVNGVDITFRIAKTDWGHAEYFGIYDSLANGNLIVAGKLTKPKHIAATNIASIFVGNLEVELSYIIVNK